MSISGASRSLSSRKTTATRRAATVGAALLVCSVQVAGAQEPRPEPPPARDIPERYSRQVAPAPSTYWRSPDLRDYTRALKPTEAPLDRKSTRLNSSHQIISYAVFCLKKKKKNKKK